MIRELVGDRSETSHISKPEPGSLHIKNIITNDCGMSELQST